jgi:putative aldouronate transport system substrate-binding protein
MSNEWWTKFFEESNTKWDIDWIPNNDYAAKMDMILASGDLPEILIGLELSRPTLVSAIKAGAFHNLSKYLGDFSAYPNLKDNPTPGAWKYVSVDGSIWSIPRSRPQIDLGLKYRKDWFEKLNIPIPTTVEEYKQALIKLCASDPDGNGQKDTIGLVGFKFLIKDSDGTLESLFGCRDQVYDADGGLVHRYLTPAYSDMVNFMRELYEGDALAKEFSVMSSTQAEDIFNSGMAVSYTRNIWRDYSFEQNIRKVQPDAVVDTLPPLKGPDGKQRAALEPGVYGGYFINAKMKEDKLLRVLDYFESVCNEYWLEKAYFGWENVHFTLVDGQKTLNDLGKVQVGTSVQQPLPMMANTWAKVLNPSAPKAYNDAKLAQVQVYQEVGQVDPFGMIVSDSWTATWPKFREEFEANVVKTIVGQITVDEFRAYQKTLSDMPEFKKAFQEFKASYEEKF